MIDKKSLRIIYFGTPEFAVAPLDELISEGWNVTAVVTAPDKPAGRGKKLTPPPVKIWAEQKNIPVYQPEKLKNPDFLAAMKNLKADLMIVVAFRMMPQELWSMPALGTFNLHASLLPQYRGAAPINRVIMNGETETGLTTFFIDHKIDTGKILLQEKLRISEKETAGELHDRMMEVGGKLVVRTTEEIATGKLSSKAQSDLINPDETLREAPKLFKEDCRINWELSSVEISNTIRGLSPYPGAFGFLKTPDNKEIQTKILRADYKKTIVNTPPGTIQTDGKTYIHVVSSDGYIEILELQLAGKKRMPTDSFLRGFQGITNMKFI